MSLEEGRGRVSWISVQMELDAEGRDIGIPLGAGRVSWSVSLSSLTATLGIHSDPREDIEALVGSLGTSGGVNGSQNETGLGEAGLSWTRGGVDGAARLDVGSR